MDKRNSRVCVKVWTKTSSSFKTIVHCMFFIFPTILSTELRAKIVYLQPLYSGLVWGVSVPNPFSSVRDSWQVCLQAKSESSKKLTRSVRDERMTTSNLHTRHGGGRYTTSYLRPFGVVLVRQTGWLIDTDRVIGVASTCFLIQTIPHCQKD